MTPEDQEALDNFQGDPADIPMFGLIVCGVLVALSLEVALGVRGTALLMVGLIVALWPKEVSP